MRAHNWKDLTGLRFGKWSVLWSLKKPGKTNAYWHCRCDCGREFDVGSGGLRSGRSSCCRHCRVTKHGACYTTTYKSWNAMHGRCMKRVDYRRRGITICPAWADFSAFLRDMGERPNGMEIDRIDNDKGYSKDNCRWATKSQNTRNRSTGRWMMVDGGKLCVSDAAEKYGISRNCLYKRLNRGWAAKRAIDVQGRQVKKKRHVMQS